MVGGLTAANASVHTVKGELSISWETIGNSVILNVIIPVGSKSKIKIPKVSQSESYRLYESGMLIWEGGRTVQQSDGISKITETGSCFEVEAGSGSYSFRVNNADGR